MVQIVSITRKIERQSNQQHLEKLTEECRSIYVRINSLKEIAEYSISQMFDAPPPDKLVAELHRKSAEVKRRMIQLKGLI